MPYEERLKISATASVVIHVAALLVAGFQWSADELGASFNPTPIVLNLQLPPERPQLRVIEAGVAADREVAETDLISSQDSAAQSTRADDGDAARPSVDRLDEFDELGRDGSLTQPEPVQMAAVPRPEQVPKPAERVPERTEVERPVHDAPPPAPDAPRVVESAEMNDPEVEKKAVEPEEIAPPEETAESEEATQLAMNEQNLPPQVQDLRASRGREQGNASPGGLASFEARKHELGEYMLIVRGHVEREWRTALHIHYPGVRHARALLDCSIRPDGTLEYVRIVESGDSPGFATLCKAAVERASKQFPPFPFDVPEIYQSKNLEVRWQFTYM